MYMKKSIHLTIAAFFAFSSGHLAYAKYQSKQINVPPEAVYTTSRTIKRGKASWYSKKDPGIRRRTANNEIFDDQDMTCAMWDVPFDQLIKVTNLANGRSVIVRVNDRGPHRRYVRKGRVIDLSKAAFASIAPLKRGLIDIELELL